MSVIAASFNHSPYRGYGFPPEIIAHAVWLYFRFHLIFRDVQDLLAERGIVSRDGSSRWLRRKPEAAQPGITGGQCEVEALLAYGRPRTLRQMDKVFEAWPRGKDGALLKSH